MSHLAQVAGDRAMMGRQVEQGLGLPRPSGHRGAFTRGAHRCPRRDLPTRSSSAARSWRRSAPGATRAISRVSSSRRPRRSGTGSARRTEAEERRREGGSRPRGRRGTGRGPARVIGFMSARPGAVFSIAARARGGPCRRRDATPGSRGRPRPGRARTPSGGGSARSMPLSAGAGLFARGGRATWAPPRGAPDAGCRAGGGEPSARRAHDGAAAARSSSAARGVSATNSSGWRSCAAAGT